MWASWASGLRARLKRPDTQRDARILVALIHGAHLKSHRSADGDKTYALHRADGSIQEHIPANTVHQLVDAGLLVGNMKFPAATYLLTLAGLRAAQEQQQASDATPTLRPLTPR